MVIRRYRKEKNEILEMEFSSLSEFYMESKKPKKPCREDALKKHLEEEDSGFRGMSNENLKKYMYTYPDAEKMSGNEIPTFGGSSIKYKYSEDDGDDMCYERFMDGEPFMKKRIRQKGIRGGRIITMYINMTENAYVTAEQLMYKAESAIILADSYEAAGYRVEMIGITYIEYRDTSFEGVAINSSIVKIPIKRPEMPLQKGLIYTAISPWMFRYHLFALYYGKMMVESGLGSARPVRSRKIIEEDERSILLDSGECLKESSRISRFREIEKQLNIERGSHIL